MAQQETDRTAVAAAMDVVVAAAVEMDAVVAVMDVAVVATGAEVEAVRAAR